MKKNEYIEFIKDELSKAFNEVRIFSENFHGPHWHIEIGIKYLKIKIYGDIGFQVEILTNDKIFNLAHLDKKLLGKQSTSLSNIKFHLESLIDIIIQDKINFEENTMDQVCQDLKLELTPDWGIINSDRSRVKEFINYIEQNAKMPFEIHYNFLELIIASMNDAILEEKVDHELNTKFYNYVLNLLDDKKYYPHIPYWIGISSEGEFPVGYLLKDYLKINNIDISNW